MIHRAFWRTAVAFFCAALVPAVAGSAAQTPSGAARAAAAVPAAACPAWLNHTFRKLHSTKSVNLCEAYAGRPMLIINTASHCGFTPQFKGLEEVHARYREQGLVVVGFASDDFDQEAGDEAEAADTCFLNFGVTFTMLAPSSVKGAAANPVFRELARQSEAPGWNFNKYLVGADGVVRQHFGSRVAPDSAEFRKAVAQLVR